MNLALTSHILVNEASAPVPLPFHTTDFRGDPCTVTNFIPPHKPDSTGRIVCETGQFYPSVCDLRIVSENEFMAAQAGEPPFYLIDAETGAEVTLPHYLPDDQTVTSITAEELVVETTRAIRWLDPAKYGLSIVAYCNLQVVA